MCSLHLRDFRLFSKQDLETPKGFYKEKELSFTGKDAWPAQMVGWVRGRGRLPQGILETAEMMSC